MNKKTTCFVVQKHQATTLHYDFRLEINGVLKSWAIPKGPSKDPNDKRLAVPTDDHALEYKDFEGVIPEGQYGAGKVTIWDKGTYDNLRDEVSMAKAYQEGKIKIRLKGKKLKGNYSLIKIKGRIPKQKAWLLIKMRED